MNQTTSRAIQPSEAPGSEAKPADGPVTVLVADDHGFIRAGVEAVLRESRFVVVGSAATGEETLDAIRTHDPAIVLLDLNMPGMNGVRALEVLRNGDDRRKVVLLTAELADRDLIAVMKAGVDGIVFKDGAEDDLIAVLDRVDRGEQVIEPALMARARDLSQRPVAARPLGTLTPREMHIARLVAQGLRNREIGDQLGIGEGTVKVYLHAIYQKLAISNRTELALIAVNSPEG